MKVLIFGGTRFMGRYMLDELLRSGASVTIANRGTRAANEGSVNVICDRSLPGALDQFEDSHFDAIIDFSAYSSDWVKEAGEFFANKVSHYIFISTGAVYTNSSIFPIEEDFPIGPPHPFAAYALEKTKSETYLLEFSAKGYFKTTSCRLPFVLGPDNYEDRESFVFSRILNGDPILLSNGGKAIHSFIYAGDVAKAVMEIIGSGSKSDKQAFNIAISQTITSEGFVESAARACGHEAKILSYNPAQHNVDVTNFDLRNVAFPFPALNAYLDSGKIKRTIGFVAKENLDSMMKIYYKWWLENCDPTPKEYPLEQRVLQELRDKA